MTEEIVPCKFCGGMPQIIVIDGLYYAQCVGHVKTRHGKSGPCMKWGPFEHLGVNRRACIKTWNEANSRNITKDIDL